MPNVDDFEHAIEYVSGSIDFGLDNRVIYDKRSKTFYYESEETGETIPEDLDWSECVEIPHKRELNLGSRIVFEFVEQVCPDEIHYVRDMFRRRGAYGRFKEWLYDQDLIDRWYKFERAKTCEAIKRWCREHGIELDG